MALVTVLYSLLNSFEIPLFRISSLRRRDRREIEHRQSGQLGNEHRSVDLGDPGHRSQVDARWRLVVFPDVSVSRDADAQSFEIIPSPCLESIDI
jgi:hypothetical protein